MFGEEDISLNSRSRSLFDKEIDLLPHEEMRLISAAIQYALRPFKPGMIICNLDELYEPGFVTVQISVHLLLKYPFKHRFDVLTISDSYLGFAEQIAELAAVHYASLPRIPPEDHIILGTD